MKKFELLDFDFTADNITVYYSIIDKLYVTFIFTIDPYHLYIEKEPDSCPTYVPYGEQMVLYDNGSGQIINIDAIDAVDINDINIYLDLDNEKDVSDYSNSDLAKILGISEKDYVNLFNELEEEAEQLAIDKTAEFYIDNQELIPEDLLYWEETDYIN